MRRGKRAKLGGRDTMRTEDSVRSPELTSQCTKFPPAQLDGRHLALPKWKWSLARRGEASPKLDLGPCGLGCKVPAPLPTAQCQRPVSPPKAHSSRRLTAIERGDWAGPYLRR